MANKDRAEKWLGIVAEDLSVAEDLFKTGHWLYVGFMCHQVIEKTLKAYWCKTQTEDPPYIHNLAQLAIRTDLYGQMTEEQQRLIALLMPMNIEARYPEYKAKLEKSMTDDFCHQLTDNTIELHKWIKSKL